MKRHNEELISTIRKLIHEKWTFNRIAEKFGITRSAVAGIVSRNGIRSENSDPDLVPRTSREKPPASAMKYEEPKTTEPPAAPDPLMLGVEDLTSTTCRWPIGDPRTEDFGFCGAPCPILLPYCSAHTVASIRPPSQGTAERNRKAES